MWLFFQNGSNYDFHILIRELIYHNEHNVIPIAKSYYNFIKFDWGMFRFIDSMRFLNSSEEKLANQPANRTEDKNVTFNKDKYGKVIENFEKFIELRYCDCRLLTKKGALPYQYISQ